MGTPVRLSTPDQLSHLLIGLRKRQRLNQTQVGKRLSLAQSRISHLESHPADISVDELLQWLSVLGLELQVAESRTSALPAAVAAGSDEPEW